MTFFSRFTLNLPLFMTVNTTYAFIFSQFITAQTAFYHCTFSLITAPSLHVKTSPAFIYAETWRRVWGTENISQTKKKRSSEIVGVKMEILLIFPFSRPNFQIFLISFKIFHIFTV